MAIFIDDFSSYSLNTQPTSNWTVINGTNDEGDEIESNAEAAGGQVFRKYNPSNSKPEWSPNAVDSEDVAIKIRFYPRNVAGTSRTVILKAYCQASSTRGVTATFRYSGSVLTVTITNSGGGSTVINTSAHTFTEGAWHIAELIVFGAGGVSDPLQIKARCYQEGAPIPAYATASSTSTVDTTSKLVAFTVGNSDADAETDFDYFQVLTNGDQPTLDSDENGQGQFDNLDQGQCYQFTLQHPDENCDPQVLQLTF